MFSEDVLQYYHQLDGPTNLPLDVGILNPYLDQTAFILCQEFYHKYYNDNFSRSLLFGINPGRFGAGLTGIPFTDTKTLTDYCGIKNDLPARGELSSTFIYEMINAFGGVELFYQQYFISAISPLGYVRNGVNLNYYDFPNYRTIFEPYVVQEIRSQLQFNIDPSIGYCIGKGTNFDFFKYLNDKYQFFKNIKALPHPRWVMQYKLKKKQVYIDQYLNTLK